MSDRRRARSIAWVLLLAIGLAAAPARADERIAVIDLRPTRAGGGETELDLLTESVRMTEELRRVLRERGGLNVLTTDEVKRRLGKLYRVAVFACRENRACVATELRPLAMTVLLGRIELDGGVATVRVMRMSASSGAVEDTAAFPLRRGEPLDDDAVAALLAMAGVAAAATETAAETLSETAAETDSETAAEAEVEADTGDDAFDFGDGDGAGDGDDAFDFGDHGGDSGGQLSAPSPMSVGGFVRTDWGMWSERLDGNAFAKGRQNLDVWMRYKSGRLRILATGHVEYDTAYLHERDSYDAPTLAEYGRKLDTRELQASLSLGPVELTAGRQIVPWGEGVLTSPVDVVNPRDLREPGLVDLEDARLPVTATRLGYFRGAHRVELMVAHESYFGYRPPPFGPFSPVATLIAPLASQTVRYRDLQDRFALDNQQLFARWVHRGDRADVGMYAASVLDQQGVLVLPTPEALAQPEVQIALDHRRYTMLGTSGAWPMGSWIVRWELAVDINRPITTDISESPEMPAFAADEATILTPMLTGTYSGVRDTTITAELSRGIYVDEPDGAVFPLDAPVLGVRASRRLLRDDLEITSVAYLSGASLEYGWLLRGELRYRLREALRATVGYVTYHPGPEFGPIAGLSVHDRVFGRLRWDFTLL